MLGLDKQSLVFPQLIFVRDGELIRESFPKFASNPPPTDPRLIKLSKQMVPAEKTSVRIYRLDWSYIDAKKEKLQQERYEKLFGKVSNETVPPIPFVPQPSLPRSYSMAMDALEFAIPDSYMKAINHCCLSAMMEWEHPYPFDTVIREACLKPAIAYIKTAFHLIGDCVYDPYKSYYTRSWETKGVFEQTAIVRFWIHQTGLYCAFRNAGFEYQIDGEMVNNMFSTYGKGMVRRADGASEPPTALERLTADMGEFYRNIQGTMLNPDVPQAKMVMPKKKKKNKV